jgi:hypothetical protein
MERPSSLADVDTRLKEEPDELSPEACKWDPDVWDYIGKDRPEWNAAWSIKNVKLAAHEGNRVGTTECAPQAMRRVHGYLNHKESIGANNEMGSWRNEWRENEDQEILLSPVRWKSNDFSDESMKTNPFDQRKSSFSY